MSKTAFTNYSVIYCNFLKVQLLHVILHCLSDLSDRKSVV